MSNVGGASTIEHVILRRFAEAEFHVLEPNDKASKTCGMVLVRSGATAEHASALLRNTMDLCRPYVDEEGDGRADGRTASWTTLHGTCDPSAKEPAGGAYRALGARVLLVRHITQRRKRCDTREQCCKHDAPVH